MDGSRDADLVKLRSVYLDTSKPRWVQAAAYRAFTNIQKQLKDRTLTKLRHELIGAVRANDHPSIGRVEKKLEVYSWRNGYAKPPQ